MDADTPDGRYDIEDGLYVNVMTYSPRSAEGATFETHRKWADLQYILSGSEFMGVPDAANARGRAVRRGQGHRDLIRAARSAADEGTRLGAVFAGRGACAEHLGRQVRQCQKGGLQIEDMTRGLVRRSKH